MLHPKKVGTLPVNGSDEEKQTNEIKIAVPLLSGLDIHGKTITADALLTQTAFGRWLVKIKNAHYHFTVKGNQKQLLDDITFYFNDIKQKPDHATVNDGHGRIETRKIWVTTDLNSYLLFPYVGQAFMIERTVINQKSGKETQETVYGITSKTPDLADAEQILKDNRGHWCIENTCHYVIDWNYNEDRSRIRTGHGPENISRIRRFAVGILKQKKVYSVAQKMRRLNKNMRAVFDYLKMTRNSCHS
ncbi:MAG: ISAs1 family transposase [Desulfobacula sp.]|nr:ISAs1 family transposase [Desulfobacula sp.]